MGKQDDGKDDKSENQFCKLQPILPSSLQVDPSGTLWAHHSEAVVRVYSGKGAARITATSPFTCFDLPSQKRPRRLDESAALVASSHDPILPVNFRIANRRGLAATWTAN